MGPDQVKAAIEALKKGDGNGALQILEDCLVAMCCDDPAAAGGSGEMEMGGTPPPPPSAEAPDEPAEDPLKKKLCVLAGRPTLSEALDVFTQKLARLSQLDADATRLENAQRVELVAELVKLGAELPSTAWEGDPSKRTPVKRLSAESLDELKARVAKIREARGGRPRGPEAPTGPTVKLSAFELKEIKRLGWTPEEYAEKKRNAARRVNAPTEDN